MTGKIENTLSHRLWTGFIGGLLDIYFTVFHRWRVEGVDNIPAHGPALLIINHVSSLEPVAAFPLCLRLKQAPGVTVFIAAKRELFNRPWLARICRSLGLFPLDRERIDPAAVRTILGILKDGHMLAIAPEGTRSSNGQLQAFQPVLAKLAATRRVPILPVGVIGAEKAMPVGARLPKPVQIIIRVGPVFELSEFYGKQMTDEEQVQAAMVMRAHVAELLPEWMRELPPPEAARRFTVQ
ncbi:MAG: 1-acyl-sn-glycerol-3-phosphate acyltransferase [Chloroflexi bacterium]|nr:1-acyl-sn-glycerol-3-phosphate acyltransferase [Chloroflexota bacterium]